MVRSRTIFTLLLLLAITSVAASFAAAQTAERPQVVLLDFWLSTCGPCRQMDPIVAQLKQQGYPIRKVDGNREPQIAQRFRVESYPTFILLVNGKEAQRIVGKASSQQLMALMNRYAAPQQSQQQAQRQQRQPARGVPTTFAAGPPASSRPVGGAFQVGSDLGPAQAARNLPPEITPPYGNPPTRSAQPTAAQTTQGPAPQDLLNATVRIRIEDPQGHAFGTGTIIDAREGEALVLTCGHLFKDASGQPMNTEGAVSVELFEATSIGLRVIDRIPAKVVSFDLNNDVGLLAIRPNRPVATARVAGSPAAFSPGMPVWSAGCDLGANPTVRSSQAINLFRNSNAPHVSSTGAPIQGRSGGGLFNATGEVVGVCFGADEKKNEGLYVDLTSIHAELDKIDMTALYRNSRQAPPQTLAAAPASPPAPETNAGMTPVASPAIVRGQDSFGAPTGSVRGFDSPAPRTSVPSVAAVGNSLSGMSATEKATLEEISRRASDSEVVCIVRPKTPGGKSEVITVDSVSPAFVQALQEMRGVTR